MKDYLVCVAQTSGSDGDSGKFGMVVRAADDAQEQALELLCAEPEFACTLLASGQVLVETEATTSTEARYRIREALARVTPITPIKLPGREAIPGQ